MSWSKTALKTAKRGIAAPGKFAADLGVTKLAGVSAEREAFGALLADTVEMAASSDVPEARALRTRLVDEIKKLENLEKPKKDLEKLASEAHAAAKAIKSELEKLKTTIAAREQAAKPAEGGKTPPQETAKLRAALTAEVATVRKAAGAWPSVKLPIGLSSTGQQQFALQIEQMIAADIPDAAAVRSQIEVLKARIAEADRRGKADSAFLTGPAPPLVAHVEAVLAGFDATVRGTYQGPLRGIVANLRNALDLAKQGQPVSIDQMRAWLASAKECEIEATKLNFIPDSHAAALRQGNAMKLRAKLEELLAPVSTQIVLLAAADGNVAPIEKALLGLRGSASLPIDAADRAPAEAGFVKQIAALMVQIKQEQARLAAVIDSGVKAANATMKILEDDLEKKLKGHRDDQVLAGDWKALEAEIGSAKAILGQPRTTMTPRDITVATSLAEEARKRLDAITGQFAKVESFDKDLAQVEKQIEEKSFFAKLCGANKDALEKYDPEAREELEEKLLKLRAELPQRGAVASMKALDHLQKEVTEAAEAAGKAASYIEKTAAPLSRRLADLLADWNRQDMLHPLHKKTDVAPAAFLESRTALKTALARRPPNLVELQAASVKAAEVYKFWASAALGSAKKTAERDVQAAEDEKAKKSAEAKEWTTRLKSIWAIYDAAELAVVAVKGDENALKAANEVMKNIEEDIKARQFDALPGKLADAEGRVQTLLEFPLGEKNRRRSELPKVIGEVKRDVQAVRAEVDSIVGEIARESAGKIDDGTPQVAAEKAALETSRQLLAQYGSATDLLFKGFDGIVHPIMDSKNTNEDVRRVARENGLRELRMARQTMRAHPLTAQLLLSKFSAAQSAVSRLFTSMDKYEYTLTTCI